MLLHHIQNAIFTWHAKEKHFCSGKPVFLSFPSYYCTGRIQNNVKSFESVQTDNHTTALRRCSNRNVTRTKSGITMLKIRQVDSRDSKQVMEVSKKWTERTEKKKYQAWVPYWNEVKELNASCLWVNAWKSFCFFRERCLSSDLSVIWTYTQ